MLQCNSSWHGSCSLHSYLLPWLPADHICALRSSCRAFQVLMNTVALASDQWHCERCLPSGHQRSAVNSSIACCLLCHLWSRMFARRGGQHCSMSLCSLSAVKQALWQTKRPPGSLADELVPWCCQPGQGACRTAVLVLAMGSYDRDRCARTCAVCCSHDTAAYTAWPTTAVPTLLVKLGPYSFGQSHPAKGPPTWKLT